MVEVAGGRDDDVGRPVVRLPEAVDGGRRKRADALLGSGDLAAERGVVEHREVEQDVHVLGRVVEV